MESADTFIVYKTRFNYFIVAASALTAMSLKSVYLHAYAQNYTLNFTRTIFFQHRRRLLLLLQKIIY